MATFSDYESFDGLGLANLVHHGIVSPLELLNAAIERIENRNPALNAVIHKMYDQARLTIQNPSPEGIFNGVPFLLKDLLADYSGAPMHFGSRIANQYVSQNDSELVKRFKKSGLTILGKTNTPEFGLSPTTEPELYGPTLNPWNLTKSAGGSSGGSAVAVASGMVPMAHGGDGAGSLRIPAAYCGVFGLKPSRGRTPAGSAVMRIWQGMVTEHVLTRSVRDCAAMLDVLSGPELGSLISLSKSEETFLSSLEQPLPSLRIAVTHQPFFPSSIDPEYINALQKAALLCQELGHQVDWEAFQIKSSEVALANLIIISAETSASIKTIAKSLKIKPNYKELETATAVLCEVGEHFSAADFAWATHILDMTTRKSAEFFQKYDVILTPTMSAPPPNIGDTQPDRMEKNLLGLLRHIPYGPMLRRFARQASTKYFSFIPYTPLFNITGQPAMSVPLYWDKNGLPIGMQFSARFGEEKMLLQLAAQLEQAEPWANKKPKL